MSENIVPNYSFKEKAIAAYWLMRPLNSTTAAVAVFGAMFLALTPGVQPFNFGTYVLISAAAFFTTAHSMAHNDIVDFEIDKINSPHRALPSGKLTMTQAKIFAVSLLVLACLLGFLADLSLPLLFPISLFWAFSNAMILDSYNKWLKRSGIFGNMVVAYVVMALFIYADLVMNSGLTLRVESIGIYAFFLNWGREIFKDIIDIEGDRQGGMKTIPVRYGAKGGAIIGSIVLGLAIVGSLPLMFDFQTGFVIPIILLVFNIIIIYRCINVIKHPTAEYVFRTKLLLMRIMLLAVTALSIDQLIITFSH